MGSINNLDEYTLVKISLFGDQSNWKTHIQLMLLDLNAHFCSYL